MQHFTGHKGEITALTFSPDGRSLVTGGHDGRVYLWEPSGSDQKPRKLPARVGRRDDRRPVVLVRYSTDSLHIVVLRSDPELHWTRAGVLGFWESPFHEPCQKVNGSLTNRAALLPRPDSGDLVVASTQSDTALPELSLFHWKFTNKRARPTRLTRSTLRAMRPILAGHETIFALAARGMAGIEVRDWKNLSHVEMLHTPGHGVRGLGFHPNGRLTVIAQRQLLTWQGTWDGVTPARHEPPIEISDLRDVLGVRVSPDGTRFVVGHPKGRVDVREIDTGRIVETFAWPIGDVSTLEFAPDGLRCAAGGTNGKVVVWDME